MIIRIFGLMSFLFILGCSGHHSAAQISNSEPHWYTSIDGDFTVQTPTSLNYRQDTLTLVQEDKEFLMDLGVHRGDLSPWFFEVLHTQKPAFWSQLSADEKNWWLKSMAQTRYKPLSLVKESDDRLWAEQDGRQLEIRAVESSKRIYLVVAAVPPGSLVTPTVQKFFNSFQVRQP